jgi:hypothetical protein
MNTFKKNNFLVVKKAIPKYLAEFCFHYILLKREVAKKIYFKKLIEEKFGLFGTWNDKQVPGTYSHYSDIVMETLLADLLITMEQNTNLKLIPTYSYTRIYKNGDILKKHIDRPSCEISSTLNLGGESWPIFLKNKKTHKINLNQGDMLIYRGDILEHWRESFEGNNCAQVFLHYNDVKNKKSKENKFDGRPHLGLPSIFNNNL